MDHFILNKTLALAGVQNIFSNYINVSVSSLNVPSRISNNNRKALITMANHSEAKKISVNSTISLKGIVKAIFNDTIHVQIGGKVITLPTSDLAVDKPTQ
jgi:hypothetical protein